MPTPIEWLWVLPGECGHTLGPLHFDGPIWLANRSTSVVSHFVLLLSRLFYLLFHTLFFFVFSFDSPACLACFKFQNDRCILQRTWWMYAQKTRSQTNWQFIVVVGVVLHFTCVFLNVRNRTDQGIFRPGFQFKLQRIFQLFLSFFLSLLGLHCLLAFFRFVRFFVLCWSCLIFRTVCIVSLIELFRKSQTFQLYENK